MPSNTGRYLSKTRTILPKLSFAIAKAPGEVSDTNGNTENLHTLTRSLDIVHVGYVLSNTLKPLRDVAKSIPIQTNNPTWNCQDFSWNILEQLVATGLVEPDDENRR